MELFKLFRNCPNEERRQCDDCPLLKQCMLKKTRRIIKRRRKALLKIAIAIVIIIVVAITFTVICNNKDKRNSNKKYYGNGKVAFSANESDMIVRTSLKEEQHTYSFLNAESKANPKPTQNPNQKVKSKGSSKDTCKTAKDYELLNANDRKLMEKMVYAESRGEPYEGQVAVAAVILNRYTFNKKKMSIEEIVTAKYQFADISNITEDMLEEYPNCKKAVEDALSGNDPTKQKFSEGARYFYQPDMVSEYQKQIRQGIEVLKIGNHLFHNDFNE